MPLLSNVRWKGFEMWLGSTVDFLAGALPYNDESTISLHLTLRGGAVLLHRAMEEIRDVAWLGG